MMKNSTTKFFLATILVLILSTSGFTQKVDLSTEAYIQPPKEIAQVVTAPRYLNVTLRRLSPDGVHFLIPKSAAMPTVKIYGKLYVNLGESEFDYFANRSRQFTLRRQVGFEIFNYKTGAGQLINPPQNRWVSNGAWSPDGSKIAYFVHSDKTTHIYVADAETGKAKKITATPVLATLVTSFSWTQDSKQILTVLIPEKRQPVPFGENPATGPKVRLTNKGKTPNRTYPNLMQTPRDKKMLEWLAAGQLALIDVNSKKVKQIGPPGMYMSAGISPDSKYILATIMQKPFSYLVPLRSFGTVENIYNLKGKIVARVQKHKIRNSTVSSGRSEAGANDKRNLIWRPDGKGLAYLQMEPRKKKDKMDNGEDSDEKKRKDRVIQWLPPFDSTIVKILYQSKNRIGSVAYSPNCRTLFLSETEKGKRHLFAVNLSDTSKKLTIYKYRTTDVYHNPGALLLKKGKLGGSVVRITPDGNHVFLAGTRYNKEPVKNPPFQFIHKVNFKTGETDTIFSGVGDVYESINTAGRSFSYRGRSSTTMTPVADADLNIIFTTRQSPTRVPDSYMRNLRTGKIKKLTGNKDYSPEITKAKRLRFRIERVDGFKFWVNLTLPPNYETGTKLPAMFWFYPREYTDQKSYDRSAARYNKNAFPRVSPRSMEILTRLGYAVVQPDCPIIGKQGQMNNNYVQDLRNNLWAVIDSLDKKGYIDRDRLAIGGHSYGAFGAANAMVHTPFFKAGIAGDGNYNRTLTPLTFQSERRFLWDAREVYIRMSPLLWANQLNGALLMYHGMADANTGTFLINSERMFHVLDGLGKTAALYMYPYEHHGPATRETLLDLWARWSQWLDKYVKNPQKEMKKKSLKK